MGHGTLLSNTDYTTEIVVTMSRQNVAAAKRAWHYRHAPIARFAES